MRKRPSKLNVHFSFFSYGGNGGFASCHPEVGYWFADTLNWCKNDPRVGSITRYDMADTPITMTRNRQILLARQKKAHVLVMVDSDQHPDLYLGVDPKAVPFFQSAFNFIWDNWKTYDHGCCVGSPYCGPPPHPRTGGYENVYVFQWHDGSSDDGEDTEFKLEGYTREQAATMRGIQDAAALPTGAIVFDMRCFEITEPMDEEDSKDWRGWFYYEWKDKYAAEKCSTEDVTMTRDLSLAGIEKYGYNPVFCNWSAWVGHYKPKCVGKPSLLKVDTVGKRLAKAIRDNIEKADDLVTIKGGKVSQVSTSPIPDHFLKDAGAIDENTKDAIATMVREVCRTVKPGKVIRVADVGCWVGETTKHFIDCIKANSRIPEVHSIDDFEGEPGKPSSRLAKRSAVLTAFCKNVKRYLNKESRMHRGDSVVVAEQDHLPAFHIVYLAKPRNVEKDIPAWREHLENGGFMSGYCDKPRVAPKGLAGKLDNVGLSGNLWSVQLWGKSATRKTARTAAKSSRTKRSSTARTVRQISLKTTAAPASTKKKGNARALQSTPGKSRTTLRRGSKPHGPSPRSRKSRRR